MFFASLLIFKYKKSLEKTKIQSLVAQIQSIVLEGTDKTLINELIKHVQYNPDLAPIFHPVLVAIIKNKFDDLSESLLFNLLSFTPPELYQSDPSFKTMLTEYFADNFDYFDITKLCQSHHLMQAFLPSSLYEQAVKKIVGSKLDVLQIEIITRNLNDNVSKEIIQHIHNSYGILKSRLDVLEFDSICQIILRIYENPKYFEQKFLQDLMQLITLKNTYINQKNLTRFVDLYNKVVSSKT